MNEDTFVLIVYGFLQVASLAFLPKWWKLAAMPALWLVPMIVSEHRHPSYMGDVLIAMFAIYACAYLVLAWMVFGMTMLTKRFWNSRSETDNSIRGKEGNSCQTNLNSDNSAKH